MSNFWNVWCCHIISLDASHTNAALRSGRIKQNKWLYHGCVQPLTWPDLLNVFGWIFPFILNSPPKTDEKKKQSLKKTAESYNFSFTFFYDNTFLLYAMVLTAHPTGLHSKNINQEISTNTLTKDENKQRRLIWGVWTDKSFSYFFCYWRHKNSFLALISILWLSFLIISFNTHSNIRLVLWSCQLKQTTGLQSTTSTSKAGVTNKTVSWKVCFKALKCSEL